MSLWKRLTGELVDIVEWPADRPDVLVHKFERDRDEIKHGAQLIVREGQAAVFIDQGALADVFVPGRYELTTDNLPILSTLRGWKHGFESPFKAEVYFVCTRRFTDLKWGTMNPIMLRDAEFGPVRLRAFGTYAIRASDPAQLIREVVGAQGRFSIDGISDQLRNEIVARFADVLGESRIPALDLAANYDELSRFVLDRIRGAFGEHGLELVSFLVENVSLPPEVEQALDARSKMGVLGNLDAYAKMQSADAVRDAAQNPGGGAGQGLGLGAGIALGRQMGEALAAGPGAGHGASVAPPPLPGSGALQVHVAIDGAPQGPFDATGLRGLIAQAKLKSDTLVWTPAYPDWQRADAVPAVAALLKDAASSTPPPLPPPA